MTTGRRRHEPPEEIELLGLVPVEGSGPADAGDYEAVDLAGRDLAGCSAAGATFRGCRFDRCGLDGIRLDRARILGCRVGEVAAAAIHAPDSTWQDSLVVDARIGALLASGSTWDLVRLRGVKANLVDLRAARLTDVVLEDCAIGELDLGGAELRSVRVERTTIDDLSVEGARLADVGLASAGLGIVRGIAGLRGATIGPGQLLDLAPLLAAQLGIRVAG